MNVCIKMSRETTRGQPAQRDIRLRSAERSFDATWVRLRSDASARLRRDKSVAGQMVVGAWWNAAWGHAASCAWQVR
jgi:hypothetical protein